MEEQEQLPLENGETCLLRVSPGWRFQVSTSRNWNASSMVDGVGPMEVWASYGEVTQRVLKESSEEAVGWDEARRLQSWFVKRVGIRGPRSSRND